MARDSILLHYLKLGTAISIRQVQKQHASNEIWRVACRIQRLVLLQADKEILRAKLKAFDRLYMEGVITDDERAYGRMKHLEAYLGTLYLLCCVRPLLFFVELL